MNTDKLVSLLKELDLDICELRRHRGPKELTEKKADFYRAAHESGIRYGEIADFSHKNYKTVFNTIRGNNIWQKKTRMG